MRAFLIALAVAASTPLVGHASPATPPAQPQPNPDGLDTPESRLSDARMDAAHQAFALVYARWKHGGARLDDVYRWSMRILHAELEREPMNRRDTDTSYQDHAARMHALEAAVIARHRRGLATAMDLAAARFYRSEADFLYADHRIE